MRADQLLVHQGLATSREKAQALILAGSVSGPKGRIQKAGDVILIETPLVVENPLAYVSRGGLKLEKALDHFAVPVQGRMAMDIGASTGGFTDCLLQRGAKKVYAIDVGYGQLDYHLRDDPRIVNLEKVNFRYLVSTHIPEKIELATIDVSFISLDKILPQLRSFLGRGEVITEADPYAWIVALVKPQFELTPGDLKKGIVRSDELRQKALEKVRQLAAELQYQEVGHVESPIEGAKGNKEYLLCLKYPVT